MDNGLKGLLLAAGTIITCIIVSLGFYIAREARDTAASGAGSISKLNSEFNDNDKTMYEGLSVSGSEVLNVITKFASEDICIRVETIASGEAGKYAYYLRKLSTTGYALGEVSDTKTSEAKDKKNINYINPNATFNGSVQRNSNNVITCITFIQKSAKTIVDTP
jgi:hypothetical protein